MEQNLEHEEDGRFLTFILGKEKYALEIEKVCEVLDSVEITTVPQCPDYLCGVINLRGSVVPVVEMRYRLLLDVDGHDFGRHCIIIVEALLDGEMSTVGIVADSVCEVIDLAGDQIGQTPKIGTKLHTEFVRGIGKHHEEFITLLDIDLLLSQNSDQLALAS
jgi:purine-binding chemotaxis protein CheW